MKFLHSIDILIPTRGRAKRLHETLDSIEQTMSGVIRVSPYIYWDYDDQESLGEFLNMSFTMWGWGVKHHVVNKNDNLNLSQMWNRLADISGGNILMHAGDDLIFKTKDWDLMVVEEFEKCDDKIMLVYGDDGIQGEKLATHGFYSRKAMEITDYFLPPYFKCDGNDLWWTQVYRELGRLKYLPNMNIEHMHFSKHPELMDDTYKDGRQFQNEAANLYNDMIELRMQDIEKLRQWITR
jgi:hypothetical protein